MKKQTIFSGIQPSGNLHIGNYIGAIRQWVALQNNSEFRIHNSEFIFCIVDLHAITLPQDPKVLREKNLQVAALYIACGIDPEKSHIFIQSENPDHAYLAWIFDCIIPIGWMNRMIQYKDKSNKQKESTSVGIFNYPALMAADILLYNTDLVPVGHDQLQHVELTRDVAEKFNRIYGSVFKLPNPMIDKEAARIMSLQDPMSKMSKSDANPLATINLLDSKDEIVKKIRKAVTDSGTGIIYDKEKKPAIANLLNIYARFSGKAIPELENKFKNSTYAQFKEELINVVLSEVTGISLINMQKKYYELRNNDDYLKKELSQARDYVVAISSKKIKEVKEVMGLGRK